MSKESRRIIDENKDRRDLWWRERSEAMVFLVLKEFNALEEMVDHISCNSPCYDIEEIVEHQGKTWIYLGGGCGPITITEDGKHDWQDETVHLSEVIPSDQYPGEKIFNCIDAVGSNKGFTRSLHSKAKRPRNTISLDNFGATDNTTWTETGNIVEFFTIIVRKIQRVGDPKKVED